VSDYPEHDRLAAISDQSQVCGEFLEWLQSEGLHLMRWRTGLTDTMACGPGWPSAVGGGHSRQLKLCADGVRRCMRCGKPLDEEGTYEVAVENWVSEGWVSEGRSIEQLLAAFFGIDLDKIETEKRQMLARMRGEAS